MTDPHTDPLALAWALMQALMAQRPSPAPTAETARATRHAGHRDGLPVFERPRPTAEERRRAKQLADAKAWGLDKPSPAAERMRGAA